MPKKPVRQNSSQQRDNSNREPTPDYDSTSGVAEHKEVKLASTPLATSPVKKLVPQPPTNATINSPDKTTLVDNNEILDNATNNSVTNNRNAENLNQTRGRTTF